MIVVSSLIVLVVESVRVCCSMSVVVVGCGMLSVDVKICCSIRVVVVG